MSEQQKAQLAIIVVLLVVLIIRIVPLIIKRYRYYLADKLTPYAYIELKSTKRCETSNGIGCDVELHRICNKMGLIVLLNELDRSLQNKNDMTLQELLEEMEEIKKKGMLNDVEDAD